MTRWLIYSLLFHALVFGLGWLVGPETKPTPQSVVYGIELVSFIRESGTPESKSLPSPEIPTLPSPKAPKPKKTPPTPKPETGKGEEKKGGPQLTLRGEGFPYAYYLSTLRQRIQESWHPPLLSPSESKEKIAGVVFVIRKDGTVEGVHLEKPSGHFLYDQAAQRAIYSLGRLPPLPSEFQGEKLTIHVEFEAL